MGGTTPELLPADLQRVAAKFVKEAAFRASVRASPVAVVRAEIGGRALTETERESLDRAATFCAGKTVAQVLEYVRGKKVNPYTFW